MAKAFGITSTRGSPALNITCPGISQSCRGRFQSPDESLPPTLTRTTQHEAFAGQDELRYGVGLHAASAAATGILIAATKSRGATA